MQKRTNIHKKRIKQKQKEDFQLIEGESHGEKVAEDKEENKDRTKNQWRREEREIEEGASGSKKTKLFKYSEKSLTLRLPITQQSWLIEFAHRAEEKNFSYHGKTLKAIY